jgi:DNA-binding transcriptional MerR regulator
MKTQKHYTLNELSALTDLSGRTIRFYIQEGVLDKPYGKKKGAWYSEEHLQQLLTVKKYKEAGVSLERIAQIIHEEQGGEEIDYRTRPGQIEVLSRIHLVEGVELSINPERSGLRQQDIRNLAKVIQETIESIKREKEKASTSKNPNENNKGKKEQ